MRHFCTHSLVSPLTTDGPTAPSFGVGQKEHSYEDLPVQHGKWHFKPEDGGHVALQMLQLQPVDPIAYRMSDVWGYDEDELPIEPFDIEIRVTAPTVLDGLKIFADAVQTYMLENFGGYAREQFLERLDWTDEYAEVRVCQITMEG